MDWVGSQWGFERKRCKRNEGQNYWLLILGEIIFGRFLFIARTFILLLIFIHSRLMVFCLPIVMLDEFEGMWPTVMSDKFEGMWLTVMSDKFEGM